MTTDAVLRAFAAFLTAGWPEMNRLLSVVDRPDDQVADWMQANWEVLVESVLIPSGTGFLEVYGDGAECNGASSRVFQPDAIPTHRICCRPRQGDRLRDAGSGKLVHPGETTFWGFVHWDGKTYEPAPPFDAVLLEATESVVVDIDSLTFGLEKM